MLFRSLCAASHPYFCFLLSTFCFCQNVALGGLSVQGSGFRVQGSMFDALPITFVHSSPARRTPAYEGTPTRGSQVLRRSLARGKRKPACLGEGDLPPVSPSPPGLYQ